MREVTVPPDLSQLEITMDSWTEPFWQAAEAGDLLVPKCGDCGRFRWPPGPFCPGCRSQATVWVPPGPARLYSFTVVRQPNPDDGTRTVAPALVEFPQADGIRMTAAVIDASIDRLAIGAGLVLGWSQAMNGKVPVFRLAS